MFKKMPELTQEEKIKIFEKLPKEWQNLMQSEDTGAFLLYLGKKYNLANNKIHQLSKTVGDVILGITPITSLAQEINLKVISDTQTAMSLTQELYSELLSPVMTTVKSPVQMPAPAAIPAPPNESVANMQAPDSDKYREPLAANKTEPIAVGPEIVDLRKAPITSAQTPAKPSISQAPPREIRERPVPPHPLTFTKPIIEKPSESAKSYPAPASLIEADPHKVTTPPQTPPAIRKETYNPAILRSSEKIIMRPPEKPVTDTPQPPAASKVEPQYIIRPSGLPPTDLPRDVLDLRKDKGEF